MTTPEERYRPDPSELTTAALLREIQNLEEKLNIQIEGVVKAFTARIDAIDTATRLFSEDLVRVPTALDRAITTSRALTDEKFISVEQRIVALQTLKAQQFAHIQQQLEERDERFNNQDQAAKDAVAAALQAAKEMMGEQAHNIRTITDANQTQIGDLKDRITRIEALAIGQATQKVEQHQSSSATVGLIALAVTILSVLIGLAFRFVGK